MCKWIVDETADAAHLESYAVPEPVLENVLNM
jgi:hypothetical protein